MRNNTGFEIVTQRRIRKELEPRVFVKATLATATTSGTRDANMFVLDVGGFELRMS